LQHQQRQAGRKQQGAAEAMEQVARQAPARALQAHQRPGGQGQHAGGRAGERQQQCRRRRRRQVPQRAPGPGPGQAGRQATRVGRGDQGDVAERDQLQRVAIVLQRVARAAEHQASGVDQAFLARRQ
jgi:hypothetical protein